MNIFKIAVNEAMKLDMQIVMGEDVSPLIDAIDSAASEIAKFASLPQNEVARIVANTVRKWAITGYSVQEIQARLPAYVEGVKQARHYNI